MTVAQHGCVPFLKSPASSRPNFSDGSTRSTRESDSRRSVGAAGGIESSAEAMCHAGQAASMLNAASGS